MPRARKTDPLVTLQVQVPRTWVEELDHFVELSGGERGWHGEIKRSDVMRQALRRGLDAMAREFPKTEQSTG